MGHPGRRTKGSNSLARALTWGFRCRDSGLDALPATTGLLARERCDVVPEGITLPPTTGTPLTPARRDSHSPFYGPRHPPCQRQHEHHRLLHMSAREKSSEKEGATAHGGNLLAHPSKAQEEGCVVKVGCLVGCLISITGL